MRYIHLLCLLLFTVCASAQVVYKTPSGEKYHLASCRMVKNVSQELTLKKASDLGLTACKICKPPTSERLGFSEKKQAKGEAATVQCKGMTKAGTRCKHRTSISNGYCFQHNPDK